MEVSKYFVGDATFESLISEPAKTYSYFDLAKKLNRTTKLVDVIPTGSMVSILERFDDSDFRLMVRNGTSTIDPAYGSGFGRPVDTSGPEWKRVEQEQRRRDGASKSRCLVM